MLFAIGLLESVCLIIVRTRLGSSILYIWSLRISCVNETGSFLQSLVLTSTEGYELCTRSSKTFVRVLRAFYGRYLFRFGR